MAINTIRPNGIRSNVGFTDGLGAGAHNVRLSDSSDATSVYFAPSTFEAFDLGTFTLGATKYVRRFRFVERVRNRTTSDGFTYRYHVLTPFGSGRVWDDEWLMDSFSLFTNPRGWINEALTQAEIDALIVTYGANAGGSTSDYEATEIYIEIDDNSFPTATVTLPTGNVTTTTRPVVSGVYSDADSDAMDRVQVKIFTAAQYGIGGFDPATSPNTWDSGEVSQSVAAGGTYSVTTGIDLANTTTYRAYVRVRQVVDSKWSTAWVNTTFTMALDAPAQPVVTLTVENASGRIKLDVQGRDNKLTKNQASLETDTTGWAAGANSAIARSTAAGTFLNGIASLSLTRTGSTGLATAVTPTGTSGVPVLAGQQYTALVSWKAATVARSMRIDIAWYDAAGAFLSLSAGVAANDGTGGWTQVVCTAVAPANAAFATLQLVAGVASDVAVGELHYADQISLAPGASTTWTRGGYVHVASAYRMEIERSVDGGTVWDVRENYTPDLADELDTKYDYLAPVNTLAKYRARAFLLDTLEIAGPYSAEVSGTSVPTTATGWYIKDVYDPTKNQVIDLDQDSFDYIIREEQAKYNPLGRQFPIVVSDVVRGIEGTMKLGFSSLAAYDAFKDLRDAQHVCLLQQVYKSEEWYIRFGDNMKVQEEIGDYTLVIIEFVEVGDPT